MEARSGTGSVSRCRLYLITPPALQPEIFVKPLEAALAAGDVASVQLRLKDASDEAVLDAGRVLKPVVQRAGTAFIVNDRPDLAVAIGADGVHVGQEDASYSEARAAVGKDRIVGVTCHDFPPSGDRGGRSRRRLCRIRGVFPHRNQTAQNPLRNRIDTVVGRNDDRALRRHRRRHRGQLYAVDKCRRRFPRCLLRRVGFSRGSRIRGAQVQRAFCLVVLLLLQPARFFKNAGTWPKSLETKFAPAW